MAGVAQLRRGPQGNIALELALALPLFLLLFGGMIDFSLLFWEKLLLTNASREGARAATRANLDGTRQLTADQVKNVVYGYLYKCRLTGPDGAPLVTQVAPPPDAQYSLNAGKCNYLTDSSPIMKVTVELADIPAGLMLLPEVQGLFGARGPGIILLHARTTMAAEWTDPPG